MYLAVKIAGMLLMIVTLAGMICFGIKYIIIILMDKKK